jgi:hypothetical protein
LVVYQTDKTTGQLLKIKSPAYAQPDEMTGDRRPNEYDLFAANDSFDVRPLFRLISDNVSGVIRQNRQEFGMAKVGITGFARKDLSAAELQKRVNLMMDELQGVSSMLQWKIGVLSYEMEAELEQESMFEILDNLTSKRKGKNHQKRWLIFNMGGSDARLFSRDFCLSYPLKGGKYASKAGYLTAGALEKTEFVKQVTAQVKAGAAEDNFIVLAGFFGYLFTMPLCHQFWEDIVNGKPINVEDTKHKKGFKRILRDVLAGVQATQAKVGDEQKDGKNVKQDDMWERSVAAPMLAVAWNNTDRGDLKSNLLQKENMVLLCILFLETVEAALAPKQINGVFIDNKIGSQVRKRVPKQYIQKFDYDAKKMFPKLGTYKDLSSPTTFGQQEMFSWAIPLGHHDTFDVGDDLCWYQSNANSLALIEEQKEDATAL